MDEVISSSKECWSQSPELLGASSPSSELIRWRPSQLVFSHYSVNGAKVQYFRVVVRKRLSTSLTKDIVKTYQTCNPDFHYSEELNPKRFLTTPSQGVLNGGFDNANSDLILTVNIELFNLRTQRRYIVKDLLGHGSFGQVAKCWVAEMNSFVAVKIIKNQLAYYQQAQVEVSVLKILNEKFDPEDKHHIVRIYDHFDYKHHLCIAFELLDNNLFEHIKLNRFKGLPLRTIKLFSKQILRGLALMKDAGFIHCDLKPENICSCTSAKPEQVKIIDFGSACMEHRTVYSYIQSRHYRSPEVLLGYPYSAAIDMWSFGCIVAELFLGFPLFPGQSGFDLLRRMIKILGGQPPDYILKEAKNTSKFFKCVGSINHEDSCQVPTGRCAVYKALTEEEYEARESKKPVVGKEYFGHMNLEAIVKRHPYWTNLPEEEIVKESQIRLVLIDFLRGLVEFDPAKRWSPLQASKHPFVTGEPFMCPYKPSPETPCVIVPQNVKLYHHPARGHWFAAGLSPNIQGRNHPATYNSPHFQFVPYSHAGSYSSLGSHGSNDGVGLGGSYGSYGDNGILLPFNSPLESSGVNNICAQRGFPIHGTSLDTMIIQMNELGLSPGNFSPMSLGTSPSQFTPPRSYGQITAGSPGHYGPTSTARGSTPGSPLGNSATFSQYSRRRGWPYAESSHSQEKAPSLHWQRQAMDASISIQAESNSLLHPSHNTTTWMQQHGTSGITAGYPAAHNLVNSYMQLDQLQGSRQEKWESSNSLPDPGDWDPNYSEELLLQEDGSEFSCMTNEFGNRMHLGQVLVSKEHLFGWGRSSNKFCIHMPQQRINEHIQVSLGEAWSPPSTYGLSSGFVHPMAKSSRFMPHISQNSPSRSGQPPVQLFNLGRPSPGHQCEDHFNPQAPLSGSHSPRKNCMPGGHRSNHNVVDFPPPSPGRRDYG